jgi:Sec-independent protein translocase protein TatA
LIRIAGVGRWWYLLTRPDVFVSLLLLALLLFLLFGGGRIGAAGKGLGQAARHVKRALAEEEPADADPKAPPPTMNESSERQEPKLLPAKGESSASSGGES